MTSPPPLRKQVLKATGLSKTYQKKAGPEVSVLRGVDFEIYEGDRIAIIGKSGSGKSTLLHILGTLDKPTAGEMKVGNQSVFSLSESELASFRNRQMGFVFQFHYLMVEFSAVENVMMPMLIAGMPSKAASDRAKELLTRVGLGHRLDHRPSQLSGGEQSRVAIARALANQPRLLLTDEMTGNLDQATGLEVFELILSLQQEHQIALVSVTHDPMMAQSYQRVLSLEEGRLMDSRAVGSP